MSPCFRNRSTVRRQTLRRFATSALVRSLSCMMLIPGRSPAREADHDGRVGALVGYQEIPRTQVAWQEKHTAIGLRMVWNGTINIWSDAWALLLNRPNRAGHGWWEAATTLRHKVTFRTHPGRKPPIVRRAQLSLRSPGTRSPRLLRRWPPAGKPSTIPARPDPGLGCRSPRPHC